jgi:hypothetical protein
LIIINSIFARVSASKVDFPAASLYELSMDHYLLKHPLLWTGLLLGILCLAGFPRLDGLDLEPWYQDEGVTAEMAACLAAGRTPAIGAVKQNGLLPLSSSLLAPATISPLIRILGLDPMRAARLWAVFLGLACVALLALTGLVLARPLWGLASALFFAALPLAVDLGRMAFYHHLAAALSLLCLLAARQYLAKGRKLALAATSVLAGLALASAYWLFWLLPLLAALAVKRRQARELAWALPLACLPLAWSLAGGYGRAPEGFLKDLNLLSRQASIGINPWKLFSSPLLAAVRVEWAYPFFLVSLAGWAWWISQWKQRGKRVEFGWWMAVFGLACSLEAIRQRENLAFFSYPLIPALPWACLGLGAWAALCLQLIEKRKFLKAALWLVPLVASLARPFHPDSMKALSVDPAQARPLVSRLSTMLRPGDLVLGQVSFNWALPPQVTASDLDQAAAFEGKESPFLAAGYPPSRFITELSLEKARFLVMSTCIRMLNLHHGGARSVALKAEMAGWPLVWSNPGFQVFANPAFLPPGKYPKARVIDVPYIYDDAALDALAGGNSAAARFALNQGLSYQDGKREWRMKMLGNLKSPAHQE